MFVKLNRICLLLITLSATACFAADQTITLVSQPSRWCCGGDQAEISLTTKLYQEYASNFAELGITQQCMDANYLNINCSPEQLGILIKKSLDILKKQDAQLPTYELEDLIRLFHYYGETSSNDTNEALCNNFLLPVLNQYPSIYRKKQTPALFQEQNYTTVQAMLKRLHTELDKRGTRKGVLSCGTVSTLATVGAVCSSSEAVQILLTVLAFASGMAGGAALFPAIEWESRPIVDRVGAILDGRIKDFKELHKPY